MPFILTDAGESLEANNLLNGTTSGITAITLGEGNRVPDGTEVALVQPFAPVRELANPRGAVQGNQGSVDWEEEANANGYLVKEASLWVGATMVGYESNAAGNVFVKTANQRIVHRFLWVASSGALNTFTFANIQNVAAATEVSAGIVELADTVEALAGLDDLRPMTPEKTHAAIAALISTMVVAATRTVAGIAELASNAEADAAQANASDSVIVTPSKWWRMFTGARIVARLTALAGTIASASMH